MLPALSPITLPGPGWLTGGAFLALGDEGGEGEAASAIVAPPTPLIADTRWMDGCEVSASSEASSDFAAANVRDSVLSKSWRPATAAGAYLDFALVQRRTVDLVMLALKCSTKVQWRVKGASTPEKLASSPEYTSDWQSDPDYDADAPVLSFDMIADEYQIGGSGSGSGEAADRDWVIRWLDIATVQTWRHWRVEVEDPTCWPNGAPDVGFVMLAQAWRPSLGAAEGVEVGVIDDSELLTARGGAIHVDGAGMGRTLAFEIDYLPGDEALEDALGLMRRNGKKRPVFVVLDSDADGIHAEMDICFGHMVELPSLANPVTDRRAARFLIRGQHK